MTNPTIGIMVVNKLAHQDKGLLRHVKTTTFYTDQ